MSSDTKSGLVVIYLFDCFALLCSWLIQLFVNPYRRGRGYSSGCLGCLEPHG